MDAESPVKKIKDLKDYCLTCAYEGGTRTKEINEAWIKYNEHYEDTNIEQWHVFKVGYLRGKGV